MTPTFDPEKHEYRDGAGRVLPSVTQIIRESVECHEASDWYLQRGTAVHAAVALALQGKLDYSSLDPRIRARVQAAVNIFKDKSLEVVAIEKTMASAKLRFAGTTDLIAKNYSGEYLLYDWKSSYSPESLLQLAAYKMLWDESNKVKIQHGCILEIRENGGYHCYWRTAKQMKADGNVFLHALSLHAWKSTNNKLRRQQA